MFVDLSDSTAMKQGREPEEWLGSVFEFIRRCEYLAGITSGTVVKRIGDEVMLTFAQCGDSENFVEKLISDAVMSRHRYKVSVDTGKAYHFRFISHLEDDPYGPVVDRCARIARLAMSGCLVCSSDYLGLVQVKDKYVEGGIFTPKGFESPVKLFVRSLIEVDSSVYLQPLMAALRENSLENYGYRYTSRQVTPAQITTMTSSIARPFLARELLNVPRLPLNLEQLTQAREIAADKRAFQRDLVGYFVEWEGAITKIERRDDYIHLDLKVPGDYWDVGVTLPLTYWEVLKTLRIGGFLRVRGVIERYSSGVWLNYADVQVVSKGSADLLA